MRSALIFDEPSTQHPLLQPSHPILLLYSSLPLSGSICHICKLTFLFAALLCFGASVSPPATSVPLSQQQKGVEGFGNNFSVSVSYLLLEAQQRFQSNYSVYRVSNMNCCGFFHFLECVCFSASWHSWDKSLKSWFMLQNSSKPRLIVLVNLTCINQLFPSKNWKMFKTCCLFFCEVYWEKIKITVIGIVLLFLQVWCRDIKVQYGIYKKNSSRSLNHTQYNLRWRFQFPIFSKCDLTITIFADSDFLQLTAFTKNIVIIIVI